jgi:hypothetical protein
MPMLGGASTTIPCDCGRDQQMLTLKFPRPRSAPGTEHEGRAGAAPLHADVRLRRVSKGHQAHTLN